MAQPTDRLVVQHRSAGVAMGTLDAFFLMRCYGDTSPEDIYAGLKCHEAILAGHPRGSISIVALDATSSIPSEATRRAAVEVSRTTASQTLGQVIMVLGDGFWASAFRGILMTVTSLNQSTYPKKIVRYEEEGVEWAIQTLGESMHKYRSVLLAALTELHPAAASPVRRWMR